jgi:hypothetical protein
VGRQILLVLSFADEERLMRMAVADGFVVMPHRVMPSRLEDAAWRHLPDESAASPLDYECVILSRGLLEFLRRATSASLLAILVGKAGDYHLDSTAVPSIEWSRTRRGLWGPEPSGGRLYVNPGWDYGALSNWQTEAVAEYDELVRAIRGWTVRRRGGYWSKELAGPNVAPRS